MGFMDKVMFWKKNDDFDMGNNSFDNLNTSMDPGFGNPGSEQLNDLGQSSNNLGEGSNDLGLPPSGDFDPGSPGGYGDAKDPFLEKKSFQQGFSPQAPPSDSPQQVQGFSQQSPGYNTLGGTSYQEVPQNMPSHSMDVISAKLDAIRATLDAINQRLTNLERNSLENPEQPKRRNYGW